MSFPAGRHRSTGYRVAGSDRLPGLLATVPGRLARLRGLGAPVGPGGLMSHGEDDGDATAWTEQTLRTLAAVFLVTWSFRLAGYLTFGTWVAVPVALMGLTGLLALVAAWLPRGTLASRRQRQIDVAVLAAVIVAPGHLVLLPDLHRPRLRHRRGRLRPVRGPARAARRQPVPALHGGGVPALPRLAQRLHVPAERPAGHEPVLPGARLRAVPATARDGRHHPGRGLDRRRSLGARRGSALRGAAAGSWRRSRPSWSASTSSPGTPSAGSPTSCSSRC